MLLAAPPSTFQLSILGYQHPDAAGEPYDANWLSIHVEAAGADGAWTGTDPCLLTYEAVRLADWLDAVGAGREAPPAISFLEPVLLFRVVKVSGEKVLRVHFGNLINPSWRIFEEQPARPASPDISLDFPLRVTDLRAAAADLRAVLRRYPDRAEV
jgi:hypothetical protein